MKEMLAIAGGGAVGSVLRYLIASGMSAWLGKDFPYGTFTVNFVGSCLMGFLAILILDRMTPYNPIVAGFVLVGFLGAFTTFSTFSMDTFRLLFDGQVSLACINIAANVVFCIVGTALGYVIAMRTLTVV